MSAGCVRKGESSLRRLQIFPPGVELASLLDTFLASIAPMPEPTADAAALAAAPRGSGSAPARSEALATAAVPAPEHPPLAPPRLGSAGSSTGPLARDDSSTSVFDMGAINIDTSMYDLGAASPAHSDGAGSLPVSACVSSMSMLPIQSVTGSLVSAQCCLGGLAANSAAA